LMSRRAPPVGFAATHPMKGREGLSRLRLAVRRCRLNRPLYQRADLSLQGLYAPVQNEGEDRQGKDEKPDHA
jgi:hypothetical protein